jgi:hypothetical protein
MHFLSQTILEREDILTYSEKDAHGKKGWEPLL